MDGTPQRALQEEAWPERSGGGIEAWGEEEIGSRLLDTVN